jgi:hypothetical protein
MQLAKFVSVCAVVCCALLAMVSWARGVSVVRRHVGYRLLVASACCPSLVSYLLAVAVAAIQSTQPADLVAAVALPPKSLGCSFVCSS